MLLPPLNLRLELLKLTDPHLSAREYTMPQVFYLMNFMEVLMLPGAKLVVLTYLLVLISMKPLTPKWLLILHRSSSNSLLIYHWVLMHPQALAHYRIPHNHQAPALLQSLVPYPSHPKRLKWLYSLGTRPTLELHFKKGLHLQGPWLGPLNPCRHCLLIPKLTPLSHRHHLMLISQESVPH
jgi:hypothetical protein